MGKERLIFLAISIIVGGFLLSTILGTVFGGLAQSAETLGQNSTAEHLRETQRSYNFFDTTTTCIILLAIFLVFLGLASPKILKGLWLSNSHLLKYPLVYA